MKLIGFTRYLRVQSDDATAFRDVFTLLDSADAIREKAQYDEDVVKQREAQRADTIEVSAFQLVNKVVQSLCNMKGSRTLDVARRAVEIALNESKEMDVL